MWHHEKKLTWSNGKGEKYTQPYGKELKNKDFECITQYFLSDDLYIIHQFYFLHIEFVKTSSLPEQIAKLCMIRSNMYL